MARETLYVLLFLLHIILEASVIAPDPSSAAVLFALAYWTTIYCAESLTIGRIPAALPSKALWALVFPVFALPLGAFIYLRCVLNTEVDSDIVHAVMQTTPQEVIDFSTQYHLLQFLLVNWLAFGFLAIFPSPRKYLPQPARTTSLLLVGLVSGLGTTDLLLERTSLYQLVSGAAVKYQEELARFSSLASRRHISPPLARKTRTGETFLVVIGESANRDYMGAYGFPEDTTPRLKAMVADGGALLLERAYSNHTHTNPSLSLALTGANQYNGAAFENSPSIIEIAKSAGFATAWLSNQPQYGAFNNHTSVIAKEADVVRYMNKELRDYADSARYDEELVGLLKQWTTAHSTTGNSIVFVHLMGSHAAYCNRFPDAFGEKNDLPGCYKTSLRYTDYVLDRMIESFLGTVDRGAVVYFADHAESLIRNRGHNSANFAFSMARIPVVFVLSARFAAEHAAQVRALRDNSRRLFTNDLIFDTLVGLLGIEYPGYEPRWDISSPLYDLRDAEALTLHGRKHVIDDYEPLAQ